MKDPGTCTVNKLPKCLKITDLELWRRCCRSPERVQWALLESGKEDKSQKAVTHTHKKNPTRVPIVVQWKQTQLRTMRLWVQSLALLHGLRIWHCH